MDGLVKTVMALLSTELSAVRLLCKRRMPSIVEYTHAQAKTPCLSVKFAWSKRRIPFFHKRQLFA